MSDLKTQRNVAIGVAALAVAFVVGYVVSTGTRSTSVPAVEAEAAASAAPISSPAVEGAETAPEPSTQATEARPPAPSSESPQPQAGERRRASARTPAAPSSGGTEPSGETASADIAEPVAETAPAPESAPVRRIERVTVPASTSIVLDLVTPVSSQTAQEGDEVVAELAEPLRVDGAVVVATGTRVVGRVTEAQALRKVGGKAILGLAFDRLESGDGGAEIAAAFRREGKSETGKDAATIAAGAAIGTILGNQARKNDRGKLIGAVVGAAAGTAVAAKTEGETIELPAGARLELTLRGDVEVTVDRED